MVSENIEPSNISGKEKKNAQDRPLAVDLFSGAGGLSFGFESAGFDIAAAVEYDPVHAAVHHFNFPNSKMFCRDIRDISGNTIRAETKIGNQEIMVVIGGPPCQGISLMGKREVSDPRNDLLGEYVRLVKELQPRYFVMENVAGLTVGKYKNLLTSVIRELTEVGYNVAQPKVLQAAEFGTPQSRERLFLIGARSGFSVPNYPTPIYAPRRIDGKREESNTALPSGPSVSDALFDLPNADDYEELLLTDEVQVEYGTPSEYAARLRGMKRFEGDYSLARIFDPTIMTSSLRTKHTKKSIDRFSATSPGRTEPISRFLRLHPEGICNTLRAGTASDRGAHTAPRPIHPIYSRVITVREAARLHGYPDWFRFHKTKWNGFREIGNSVPIPLGHAVASEIIKHEEIIPATKAAMELGPVELLSFSQTEAERFFGIESRVIPQRKRR